MGLTLTDYVMKIAIRTKSPAGEVVDDIRGFIKSGALEPRHSQSLETFMTFVHEQGLPGAKVRGARALWIRYDKYLRDHNCG
jgi:hypothetical protein